MKSWGTFQKLQPATKRKWIRYLSEFFVIVLGITTSFLAEDWRQNRNSEKETLLLLQKAKIECQKSVDEGDPYFLEKVSIILKQISEGEMVNKDSMLYAFELLDIEGRIIGFPSLLLLSNSQASENLSDDNISEAIYRIMFYFNYMRLIGDGNDRYVHQLEPFFQKYDIIIDLIKVEETMKSNVGKGLWAHEDLNNLKATKGNYEALLADKQFIGILREVYRYHIFEQSARIQLRESLKSFIELVD